MTSHDLENFYVTANDLVEEDVMGDVRLQDPLRKAHDALTRLADGGNEALAATLAILVHAIAQEAARTPRFARALADAFGSDTRNEASFQRSTRRPNRRAPSEIDPFAVYAEQGEDGLRAALARLDIERLKDIVAAYGMDHDRLAMKWRDSERVIGRIVERVVARAAKGSAFRSPAE